MSGEPSQPPGSRFHDSIVLAALASVAWLLLWWGYQPLRSVAYTVEADALPVMLPSEGLYEPERLPGWSNAFRWSRGKSTLRPANPGGESVLHIVLGGGPGRSVPARLETDQVSYTFTVAPPPRTYAFLLPPSPGERKTIALHAPTLHERRRDLGLMVSDLRISGGGAVPGALLLAMVAATVSCFVLLRSQQRSRLLSAAVVVVLQVLVVLWLVAGGWRYALAAPALRLAAGASLGALVLSAYIRNPQGEGSFKGRSSASASERAMGVVPSSPCPLLPAGEGGSEAPRPQGEGFGVRDSEVSESYGDRPTLERGEGSGVKASATSTWIKSFSPLLLLLALALCVRLPWLAAPDPVGDLELAARRMWFLYQGGLEGAYVYQGDYLPFRLYLLWALSHVVAWFGGSFHDPLSPVTLVAIKLPGLLADLATIAILFAWSRRWLSARRAALVAALYALAPPVWINVAWWGQVDALLLLPLVAMVLLMDREGGRWSWICWTVALLLKPQAIVFAPLLYTATLRLHGSRGFVQGAALSAVLFVVGCAPLVLAAQGPGLMQAYLGSVGRFPKLTIGAYNLWYLVSGGQSGDDDRLIMGLVSYRMVGLVLLAGVVLVVMLALLRRSDGVARVQAGAVLSLAFFMLPTQIHERYLFLSLVWFALRIASNERYSLVFVALATSATLNILGTLDGFVPLAHAPIASSPLPSLCAVANLLALLMAIASLHQQTRPRPPSAPATPPKLPAADEP